MLQLDDHFALLDFYATGQAIFLRVFVPLIEHIQLLVRWRIKIFHARGDFNGAGPAGAIKTARFHLDPGLLPGFEEQCIGGNFGGLTAR